MNEKVLILLDSDVIIHFFHAEKITLLQELFPNRLRMLDIVSCELLQNRTVSSIVENLFRYKQVEEITFPVTSNDKMFFEYLSLKYYIKGDGERASLIFCKYNQHIIASSNTTDIIPFCKENKMEYLTTLDIFSIAIKRNKITNREVNVLIRKIKSKGSFLCCNTIEEHLSEHFDNKKLLF